MTENSGNTGANRVDPDDAPELDDEFFAKAEFSVGGKVVRPASGALGGKRPGRPRSESPKEQVTLRLSAEVLRHFRSSGPGWQARIDDILKRAVGLPVE